MGGEGQDRGGAQHFLLILTSHFDLEITPDRREEKRTRKSNGGIFFE